MRAVALALGAAASFAFASASHAETGETRHAWFVQDYETGQWCAFVDEASASAAADGERFDWRESAWLKYGADQPVTLLVALQSEDAYVEDTYSFASDLSLTQVVRTGHYIDDPFFTAIYQLDETGKLQLSPQSAEASRNWEHTTYFLGWTMYQSFTELPFAAQIEKSPQISVSANC